MQARYLEQEVRILRLLLDQLRQVLDQSFDWQRLRRSELDYPAGSEIPVCRRPTLRAVAGELVLSGDRRCRAVVPR